MTTDVVTYEPVKPKTPARKRSTAGRKTNIERMEIRAEIERRERQAELEQKRAKRLQPDTRGSLAVALGIAGVGLATAGIISYATMVAVAAWMRLPWDGLDWIVPGFVELLIIFSSLDYLISKSRGHTGRAPFWAMIGFSAIAVIGNGAHTVSEWGSAFGGANWQAWIGVVLSGAAPLVVVFLSKRLSTLVFTDGES